MSIEYKKLLRTAMLGTSAIALGATAPAIAQDAADEAVEEMVVTGSRIVRKDLNSVSPISITSSEDVKLSGFTKVEDLMNSLPQIEAAQTSFISNGATGTATLDLRGMGTTRTLVLMNGRRLQPGGMSSAPDINTIPAALVKRAEVITGGASTAYGADAVAGVVNFVMDDKFEGFQITGGVSGYQHNNDNAFVQGLMDARGFDYPSGSSGIGGETYNIDMAMGSELADGKGHVTVYATWRKVTEMLQGERDYSSCALSASGTSCGGSANAIVPNFYIGPIDADGNYDWANDTGGFWTLDATEGFKDWGGNRYNYAPVNHFMRPDERYTLGAFMDYEINDMFHPYMEVSFMRDRTDAQIAESGTFFAEQYNIDYDSGLLSDAQRAWLTNEYGLTSGDQFATYIGKRNVEGGPRSNALTHNSFRIVTGTKGNLNDTWTYDASLQYGSVHFSSTYSNDFFAPKITEALANEAYDVFTIGGVTPEQASALTGVAALEGLVKEYIANAYVTGDLDFSANGGDNVQAVFGAEYRKEVFESTSDSVYADGLLLGQGGETPSVAGGYDVKEVFSEIVVPLPSNLELELAARYSDYNLSGGATTYKAAFSWSPIDEVKFVASFNHAVRAANVGELFSPQQKGLWGGVDACATATPELTEAQCANTGVTAAQYGTINPSPASQYNAVYSGNPNLKPEQADTWSFGVVASPMDDLRIRVDLWDIKLTDAIANISGEDAVRQCGLTGDAQYCDLINRSANGSLWVGTGSVNSTNLNLAGQHLRGVDVAADYEAEIAGGNLTAKLSGTYMIDKKRDGLQDVAGDEYDCVNDYTTNGCFPQPAWRHTMTASYDTGSFWAVTAKWRYFGSVDGKGDGSIDNGIKAQSYFDLKGAFDINENASLLVGVNNVFDKEPPMVGGAFGTNANTFAGYYDTLGRYLHASVTLSF